MRLNLSPSFAAGKHYVELVFNETEDQTYTFQLLRGNLLIYEKSIPLARSDRVGLFADVWKSEISVYKNGVFEEKKEVRYTTDYHRFAIVISGTG